MYCTLESPVAQDQYKPSTMNFWYWVEQPEVRRAIHVGNVTFRWARPPLYNYVY
jgi:hypothetical protein